MPKPYPNPSFNTTTGMYEYVNTITNGWATILIPIVACIIIFGIMKQQGYRTSQCFVVGFFISFWLSTFLWSAGVLAGKIVVLFLLFTIAGSLYAAFDRDD